MFETESLVTFWQLVLEVGGCHAQNRFAGTGCGIRRASQTMPPLHRGGREKALGSPGAHFSIPHWSCYSGSCCGAGCLSARRLSSLWVRAVGSLSEILGGPYGGDPSAFWKGCAGRVSQGFTATD